MVSENGGGGGAHTRPLAGRSPLGARGTHIENSYIMEKLKSVGHSSDLIGRGQKITRILCPTPHAAVPGGILVNGWPRDAARCPSSQF